MCFEGIIFMSRKQRIIISITGIFLITFLLLGFTYSFYNMKITENENTNSVVVKIGSASIEYTDLSTDNSQELIEPGYTNIRLFTVKNITNKPVEYHIFMDEVENTFVRTQDVKYTLYRKTGNNTIDVNNLSDNDIVASGTFPVNNAYILIGENLTNRNDIYTYALKVEYVNSEENQDANIGKIFGGKVQIHGSIENPFDSNTLAYHILDNAMNVTDEQKELGYAEFRIKPLTKVAQEANAENEKTLSVTNDDSGLSYYYRGDVINNYINFANMCWRIVRIEGDGSIKLILEDQDTKCEDMDYENGDGNWDIPTITGGNTKTGNFGFTQYAANTITASDGTTNSASRSLITSYFNGNNTSMAYAFKNFQTGPLSGYLNRLKSGEWCLNDNAYEQIGSSRPYTYRELSSIEKYDKYVKGETFYYDNYVRLSILSSLAFQPTLKCIGNQLNKFDQDTEMYIGALTADENMYAGGKLNGGTRKQYLNNGNNKNFWIFSLSSFGGSSINVFGSNGKNGFIGETYIGSPVRSFRPSIVLKSGVEINSGNGSIDSPYEIQ